jgi:hypothetical protein
MTLNTDDRIAIHELIALHGHLMDAEGTEAFTAASRALGDDNPLGHHVTNTVVYEDVVRRTGGGWRIAHRAVIPRNRPLHP